MSYRTTNPAGAKELLGNAEGWVYVDVRTEDEYRRGHVPAAYNVPVALSDPAGGMTPNPAFLEVMKRHFAPDTKLVLGCAMGGRSARACELLANAGYSQLVNMHGGFSGARDPFGRVSEPGWQACGFPCENDGADERSYSRLR
jgi:rhodanese-related sulfurtransferase